MEMYSCEMFAIVGISIVFDIVTGIAQAVYNKTISSTKLRNGVYHKLSYVFVMALALFIEYAMQFMELGFTTPILPVLTVYLVLTEIVSVSENILRINPELAESPLFSLMSSNQKRRSDDYDA